MSSRVWELDPNQPPTCSSSRSYDRMRKITGEKTKTNKKNPVFSIMFSS